MGRKIQILDTTLRDGNKLPFVILNTRDRLEIARQLARLGVDIIDAGYPVSSKEDRESVALIAGEVEGPYISALSGALDLDIEEALRSLEKSNRPCLHIFLPISPLFLSRILKKKQGRNLKNDRAHSPAGSKDRRRDSIFLMRNRGNGVGVYAGGRPHHLRSRSRFIKPRAWSAVLPASNPILISRSSARAPFWNPGAHMPGTH